MYQILLVDDDHELRQLLRDYLISQGLAVRCASDGEVALIELETQKPDLMVLDVMMPKLDGLGVLKALAHCAIPTIMLTAKTDEVDRIIGLELGADDYMSKPCNPRELLARIHAVLRRSRETTLTPDKFSEQLVSEHFLMDIGKRLCEIDGHPLVLTSAEFDLLFLLLQHRGEIVDKEVLYSRVLGRESSPFDRSIDVHVSRLRKKLEENNLDVIRTIRGRGYQLI